MKAGYRGPQLMTVVPDNIEAEAELVVRASPESTTALWVCSCSGKPMREDFEAGVMRCPVCDQETTLEEAGEITKKLADEAKSVADMIDAEIKRLAKEKKSSGSKK